jgi:hypothetical protein
VPDRVVLHPSKESQTVLRVKQARKRERLSGYVVYDAPWERHLDRVLPAFEQFIHRQTTGGLLLMGMAVIALILANGPFGDACAHLVHTPVGLGGR